jgi:flavorubredoxin
MPLGNMELKFFETRMLHWPDSMFTYLEADKLLFSQDAFGMHLATDKMFADETAEDIWRYEAKKYYANILLPYSNFVLKLIERWPCLQIDAQFIAADHGPIWRDGGAKIIALYKEWAGQRPAKKAVIIYDTMWGSTKAMAEAIREGLTAGGAEARLMPLSSVHRSDVATELLDASALIAGSPTLNNGIFPTLADVLTYLKGLRKKGLIGAAFGSYGWGGDAVPQLNEFLKSMNAELLGGGVKVRYVPTRADLQRCSALGREAAEKLSSLT